MLDKLKKDADHVLKELAEIKSTLHVDASQSTTKSDDIIKTVALSKAMETELKEIIILLHTSANTEFTESRMHNFKVNLEILDAASEIINLQSNIIVKLADVERKTIKPAKPTKYKTLLQEYKRPISIIMVISAVWVLAVLNLGALDEVFSHITNFIKGAKL